MNDPEKLIPLHGGYRKSESFHVAQLVYDVTVRFCDRFVSPGSRSLRNSLREAPQCQTG